MLAISKDTKVREMLKVVQVRSNSTTRSIVFFVTLRLLGLFVSNRMAVSMWSFYLSVNFYDFFNMP